MAKGLSPMMKHYLETKEKYKDAILMYRLGDFYELFFEDAEICSRVLELTLTGKDCGLEERAPMCGVPYHAVEPYVAKLIANGYKVAICEQLSEPTKGKAIVERDVVRIITPGTVIDSSMVEDRSNYLMSIYKENENIGISYLDISTGEFYATEVTATDKISGTNDILTRVRPSEILCNNEFYKIAEDIPSIKLNYLSKPQVLPNEFFEFEFANTTLKNQLNTNSLKQYNMATRQFAVCSTGALLHYVTDTQKRELSHINKIEYVVSDHYMQLDANTRRNLELTETIRERKKRGSLLWLLNKTKTKMGERLLCNYIDQPLYDDKEINYRSKAVSELTKNIYARELIGECLYNIYDIERLCGKVSYGNITPKDCVSLKRSLQLLPNLTEALRSFESQAILDIKQAIPSYDEVVNKLECAFDESSIASNQKDNVIFIKSGYNEKIDELVELKQNGRALIAKMEVMEKERTGIKNLKIGYNKVFGYYIEVTNSQKHMVPFDYIRKQTTVNGERFITEELKNLEEKILSADEELIRLQMQLFDDIREFLLGYLPQMQATARAIAFLDVLYSFASVAVERNYCKPIISKTNKSIEIIAGRHPIVEAINKDEEFVPNDTILNDSDCRTMVITGPNMAGKSTYMRQVALITLMAHIGSFVPATSAKIALTDRIFTRVGASDDLSFGQSTFMVEMSEVSIILKNATNNSLIILDEVGRGTSTFDGLSIAWSVMEYVSTHLCAKTLFATHYHELTDLEGKLEGVKNYRVSVKEFNNSVIFLRKIVRGGTNKSFGIEVASLAGLPEEVITKARSILHSLEQNQINQVTNEVHNVNSHEQGKQREVIRQINDLDVNKLTPLEAFDLIINLKNELK